MFSFFSKCFNSEKSGLPEYSELVQEYPLEKTEMQTGTCGCKPVLEEIKTSVNEIKNTIERNRTSVN